VELYKERAQHLVTKNHEVALEKNRGLRQRLRDMRHRVTQGTGDSVENR
jgi:regulator of replication initiation timing